MKPEPILGENAKAFAVQALAAIVVIVTFRLLLGDWFLAWIRQGVDLILGP